MADRLFSTKIEQYGALILVKLCDLILGEFRLGPGLVTLVGLGDLILGEIWLGHG